MTESQQQQAAQLQRVLAQQPNDVVALFQLGTLCCQAGDWTHATHFLARALQIDSNHADAWNNLGTALRNLNSPAAGDAVGAYRRSLECRESVMAHDNLAALLIAMNDPQGALPHARRATELDGSQAAQHCRLAIVLGALGQLTEGLAAAQRAVQMDERSIEARLALSATLRDTGDPLAAEHHARAAIALDPRHLQARQFAAQAVWKQGRLAEGAEEFGRILETTPADPTSHAALASIRHAQSRLVEAAHHAKLAIQANPNDPRVCNTLGNVLANQGRLTEALEAFRQALRIDPKYRVGHSNLCLMLHFDGDATPQEVLEENVEWSRRHELPLAPARVVHANHRDPDRRLRVGYVSPNMRDHAIGRMLLRPMESHDHEQVEVICYADSKPDAMSARFKACADEWYETGGLSHEALAEKIRGDCIDVLVDLTLHLSGSRLLAFARRPAPVQLSHMGYPATSGTRCIGYRITDHHLDPVGQTEAFNSEKLVRLPHSFWCFVPDENPPACAPPPVTRAGHITFGSLNNPAKVTRQTAELWSRVLHAVPDSKLMLLVYDFSGENEYFNALFGEFGIERSRLIHVRQAPRMQYLELYNQIDIVLDTMPYNGHNTSVDALFMGAALVTLPGMTSVSRAGLNFLTNIGIAEYAARSPSEFVTMASMLARDVDRLIALRRELRDRLLASPLFDGRIHAQSLEAAYRAVWREWCAGC